MREERFCRLISEHVALRRKILEFKAAFGIGILIGTFGSWVLALSIYAIFLK